MQKIKTYSDTSDLWAFFIIPFVVNITLLSNLSKKNTCLSALNGGSVLNMHLGHHQKSWTCTSLPSFTVITTLNTATNKSHIGHNTFS